MKDVEVYKDSKEIVDAVIAQAANLLGQIENPKVALSGGTNGVKIAAGLINALHDSGDLEKVKFYLADERFVELSDEQNNWGQIHSLINAGEPNIFLFQLPPESEIEQSVERANEQLGEDFSFDLALMGCGPDGHTASLFPGHTYPDQTVVMEIDSPKPPSKRISFGYRVFESSTHVWFAASGEDKATAVSQALSGNRDLPTGRISGRESTKWFITEELA